MLFSQGVHGSSLLAARIVLRDLVDWEVAGIGGGLESRMEGSGDAAKLVPGDALEEGVSLYLLGAVLTVVPAQAIVDVAEHSVGGQISFLKDR